MPLLNPLSTEAKLIQVTSTTIKHANKYVLSRLGGFSLHFSLGVEGWLWIRWVVGFGWFECFLLFVVVEARNEVRITLLTLILTSLKPNTQFVCGFGCTLLDPIQIILNHLLTQLGFLKTCSQIRNLMFKLSILFGRMEKLTLERGTFHMEGIK
jgi:hypothetical protein